MKRWVILEDKFSKYEIVQIYIHTHNQADDLNEGEILT